MDTKQSSEKRFALLIDADNVSAKYIKPITDELSKYGTVTYKRIYGDWTLTLHAKWKDALLENSITPIQQFGYTQGKNATDSAMIIDAMDILYTRSVEGFCIVSSDSDFTRLASRIRESGLTVIGMGEKKTPTPFRKACDIFTTLELLLPNAGSKPNGRSKGGRSEQSGAGSVQNAGPSIEEIEQAVANIVTDNQNNGKSTGLGEVGSRLLKRYPDFDVRSYGTNQLKKLLDEFAGIVVIKDGSNVSVELAEDKDQTKDAREKRIESSARDKGERDADRRPEREARPLRNSRTVGRDVPRSAPFVPDTTQTDEDAPDDASKEDLLKQGGQNAIPEGTAPVSRPSKGRRAPRGRSARIERKEEGALEREQSVEPAFEQDTGSEQPELAAEPSTSASQHGAVGSSEQRAVDNRPGRAVRRKTAAKRVPPAGEESVADPQKMLQPAVSDGPESFIRQIVDGAGEEGVELSVLGKRVRGKFRAFKLRDLGYTQFRSYVGDLDGLELDQRGKVFFACVAR